LAAVAAVSTAGHAEGTSVRTLRFVASPPAARDVKQIDIAPHGRSLGDQFLAAISLRRNGGLQGRAMVHCTINDQTFAGQQCTVDLVLRDGLITAKAAGLDRRLPHHTSLPGDVYAVSGGTGAYEGATGMLTIHHPSHGDVFIVRLV
jgi:hypothetical protein